jgi:sialic acid synthase SpsE
MTVADMASVAGVAHARGPNRVLIFAEAGVNHNGNATMAHRLVDAAADAGADVVKFQTFKTEYVMRRDTPLVEYQRAGGMGRDMFELGKMIELPNNVFRDLQRHCEDRGVLFLSTAFDTPSLHYLVDELDMPVVKVPSGEAVNVPFLREVAAARREVILSTGMCNLDEVRLAIDTLRAVWRDFDELRPKLTLMQCTTAYPTALEDMHVRSMVTLAETFGLPVGLSDHSEGIVAALSAVALGATIIEKHFTLDRTLPGPDHQASLDPQGFKDLVQNIRDVEAALGSPVKEMRACEKLTAATVRRSLVAVRDIAEGEPITADMLVPLRPQDGIPARDIDAVVGRRAGRVIAQGEALHWASLK